MFMFAYNKYCDAVDLTGNEPLGVLNVIKTRRLCRENKKLLNFILEHRGSTVLHVLCSGLGGTAFEPGIPPMGETIATVEALVDAGFSPYHVVLCLAPILMNSKGCEWVRRTLDSFQDTGIMRVRYSMLRMDADKEERFRQRFRRVPLIEMNQDRASEELHRVLEDFSIYTFEPTYGEQRVPVVSIKDLHVIGIRSSGIITDERGSLPYRVIGGKGKQCVANCVYCEEGCFDD